MVTYDDVKNELDSQWNDAVIAKPTFINADERRSILEANTLIIDVDKTSLAIPTIGATTYISDTAFSIEIRAETLAEIDAYRSEIIRIINDKSISGGFWGIVGIGDLRYNMKQVSQIIFCNEKVWKVYTSL